MKEVTLEWLNKAKEDLDVIERIIFSKNLTNMVAFHSQQCIEKCFKAVIEEFDIDFIRTHNLLKLYDIVRDKLSFEVDIEILEKINDTYIDARYPAELGILPDGRPDLKEAQRFYQFAEEIFNRIRAIF